MRGLAAQYAWARTVPQAGAHTKLVSPRINHENCRLLRRSALFIEIVEIPLGNSASGDLVRWLDQLRLSDLNQVGGKNASLGEMIGNLAKLGVSVPGGFATTADAFQQYLEKSGLAKRIQARLATLDVDDVDTLVVAGKEIRGWIV